WAYGRAVQGWPLLYPGAIRAWLRTVLSLPTCSMVAVFATVSPPPVCCMLTLASLRLPSCSTDDVCLPPLSVNWVTLASLSLPLICVTVLIWFVPVCETLASLLLPVCVTVLWFG